MKGKKNCVLLLLIILSYISAFSHVALMAIMSFNLFGFVDFYEGLMSSYMGMPVDMSVDITFMCIEYIIAVLFDLQCVKVYKRVYKYSALKNDTYYRVGSQNLIHMSIFQMLISSFPVGLIALITGIVLGKKKVKIEEKVVVTETQEPKFSDYKLNAMSEAIGRLKELRAQGVISEEEYYANLDKILEG